MGGATGPPVNFGSLGLRSRIGLVLAVAFAALLGIVGYFVIYLHNATIGFALERLHDNVESIARRERDKVDDAGQDLLLLVNEMLRFNAAARDCGKVLEGELQRTLHYANIAYFDVKGNPICSALAGNGTSNIRERVPFQKALAADGVVRGDVVIDGTTGARFLSVYKSVRETSSALRGVVEIAISIEALARDLDALRLPEGARLALISDKGDVIFRWPDPEKISGGTYADSEILRKRLLLAGDGTAEAVGMDGIRRLNAFTRFIRTHDGELTLLLSVPKSVVMAEANRKLAILLVAAIAIVMLAMLLAAGISDRLLIRPLSVLAETARRLGRGELTARSGLKKTGGEFGAVAGAFDDMADALMQETQRREHDFRALIDNMIECCRIIDFDWKYVYINSAFARQVGMTPEAMIGRSPLDLFSSARGSDWHVRCERVMRDRVPETFEGHHFIGTHPTGWAQFHVQPVREGIFLLSVDLTERESARHALGERIKELHCLYQVFRITESVIEPVETLLAQVVALLPPAWQYPEDTSARIEFGGAVYSSADFRESEWMQTVEFGPEGARGRITVAYRQEHDAETEGPFLREERTLLDAIANRLTGMLERHRAERAVKRSNRAVSVINACNAAMMRANDENEVWRAVCETIVREGDYRLAWVGMAGQDAARRVTPVAYAGDGAEYLAGLNISYADNETGQGPTGRAIRLLQPQVVRHIGTDPGYAPWREAALKSGYSSSTALPLILSNGECIGALSVYATVADAFDTGEMTVLAAFANDLALGIHAQRDRAARLRAQEVERQLAFVVEQTTNAVMITGLDVRLTYVNEAFVQSTGYSREEVLGRNPSLLQSGQTPAATFKAMWSDLLQGRPWSGELINRHKSGAVQILRASILPLREASGKITHYVGLTEDITSGKAAEERLRKLSMAVEQSTESIVICNLAAEIEYVNAAFLKITGYTRDEVIGRNPRVLNSGKTPQKTYDELWASLARGEPWKGEFVNRRKDGSEYIEFATIAPIRGAGGEVTHYLAIKDDITEKKRIGLELDHHRHHLEMLVAQRTRELEEARMHAESANHAKSAFLANMSHEIRTPMNAILGLTHLLRRADPKPGQIERIGKIDAAAQHLLSIINDILDFSKIEAGKLAIESIDFELAEVVADACDIFRDRAADKGLVLESFIDPAIPHFLRGDPLRLRQLLINLIGNAVKFTDRGRVGVMVRTAAGGDGAQRLRFEISDTGIGLDAAQRERLFKPFEQADASTTRRFGGTGLGLALCKRLVALSGGSIGVESEPGRGSLFWFELPMQAGAVPVSGAAAAVRPQPVAPALPAPGLKPPRILVVEDDEINREVALELLAGAGYRAEAAVNGLRALEQAAATQYDLILMDVQMPEMDGLQATRELRRRPGYEHVPIVALTANVFTEDREKCHAAGMIDFIAKPIDPDNFFSTLQRWTMAAITPPVPAAQAAAAAGHALLAVRGLDTAAGLRPVQGNWPTYERLLRRFVETRAGDVGALRQACADGDRERAGRLAHTLKGLAGTLGAHALQNAAAAVEAALKAALPAAALESLLQTLAEVHGELSAALRAALPATPAAVAEPDLLLARRVIGELDALLDADDMRAITVHQNNAALLQVVLLQHAASLDAEINAFRFPQALVILRAAAGELQARRDTAPG